MPKKSTIETIGNRKPDQSPTGAFIACPNCGLYSYIVGTYACLECNQFFTLGPEALGVHEKELHRGPEDPNCGKPDPSSPCAAVNFLLQVLSLFPR